MNWRTISASTVLAASLFVPMSSMAAPSQDSQSFRSYQVQTTVAQASDDTDMPQKGRYNKEQRMQRMQQELGLNADQVKQIQGIHSQAKQDTQGLREQMKQAREKMRQLMASNASDDEIKQQYQSIQSLRQQLSEKQFETKLAVRKVLTPEQRTKMAQMQEQRAQRRQGMRGNRQGNRF
jgi:Spy/CpxP family protein refolding chaperone